MAKITQKFVNNDIISLVNPGEVILARFVSLNDDGTITVFKPHLMQPRPTATGMSVQFADYSEAIFVTKRDLRTFDPDNFTTVDKTASDLAEHFNSMISGVKIAKVPSKLIGLGG